MKKIADLSRRERADGKKIGSFIHIYNTIQTHKKIIESLPEEQRNSIQYGLFASDLFLLFVWIKEWGYMDEINDTLESAFENSRSNCGFELIESSCKNLNEEDKVITMSILRNSIAHGQFQIPEYGADYYIFENNNLAKRKRLVFRISFTNLKYLMAQSLDYIKYILDCEGVSKTTDNFYLM